MSTQKEIKYTGFAAVPSSYESPDGQLAASVNAISEDGHIKSLHNPAIIFQFPSNAYKVLYIHKGASFTHYIVQYGEKLFWLDGALYQGYSYKVKTTDLNPLKSFPSISGINSIGNTLLILAPDGIHYFLWKDSDYTYLGNHLPECPISFGLQGEMIRSDEFQLNFKKISYNDFKILIQGMPFPDEDSIESMTHTVLAQVNKFIAENSTNSGKFIYPFFVRYALRLYDGSLTMHSSPVLMVCASDVTPQCLVTDYRFRGSATADSADIENLTCRIAGMFHQLDFLVDQSARINLQDWSDIVKSIDIFISKPIYTYDQNGKVEHILSTHLDNAYCMCRHINQKLDKDKYPSRYQYHSFPELYVSTFESDSDQKEINLRVRVPSRDMETIKADISDNAIFYLLKSYNLEALPSEREIIPVPDDYLQSLVTREVMTDDYRSHDSLIPSFLHAFNNRLNMAGLKSVLYSDLRPEAIFPFTDGYIGLFDPLPDTLDGQRVE